MSEPWSNIGPREADVLRLLRKTPLTCHQIERLLDFRGGSSTLLRLQEKGLTIRDRSPRSFFDGDWWELSTEGYAWCAEHPA